MFVTLWASQDQNVIMIFIEFCLRRRLITSGLRIPASATCGEFNEHFQYNILQKAQNYMFSYFAIAENCKKNL